MTTTRPCRLCGAQARHAFEHVVLGDQPATYWSCSRCGYLFATEADWLDRAYASALSTTDTGAAERNGWVADRVALFAWLAGRRKGKGLDFGGAHGLLVRMLRDRGLDFHWSDPHGENIFARGFESKGGRYDMVTIVEVLEHLPHPLETLRAIVEQCEPSCLVATTLCLPSPIPPLDWWYYSFETGQHIGIFSDAALEFVATSLGYSLVSVGGAHLFTKRSEDVLPFRVAMSRAAPLLRRFARRALGSRVMTDHFRLRDQLHGEKRR